MLAENDTAWSRGVPERSRHAGESEERGSKRGFRDAMSSLTGEGKRQEARDAGGQVKRKAQASKVGRWCLTPLAKECFLNEIFSPA